MEKWLGENVPKLGFGMMRLPMLADGEIDFDQTEAMVDRFIQSGFTYFDTAFGYLGGRSEGAVRRAVVERYARDKFLVATKLPLWNLEVKEDMERIFATQLERTQAGYFDYYLLHSLGQGHLKKVNDFDAWGFIADKKAKGLIRHIGFSFHDKAALLDEVLSQHPEIEFVQLQINYADWEDKDVQSRLCYEVARKYNKSVIIMEPVKGGALAQLGDEARAVFSAAKPGSTPAAWALRYAISLDHVVTALSGMSTLDQMNENIRTAQDFTPLDDADRAVIEQVRAILAAVPTIPCTDCRYCTEKCPQNIPIPAIIATDNRRLVYGAVDKGHYAFVTGGKGKASDCIACGVCEGRCPQHIKIIGLLKECAGLFE